jgi:LuxR family transcriptional regulator, maltose regulon positive regulatory protein
MTTSLLATKLFAPAPSPRSVERQRLTQRLDAGLQGKLTLVCAPAGFGKSTLLGAWVQACEHPSAWLSLDEEERDPNRFVAYLTASSRSISAGVKLSWRWPKRAPGPCQKRC